MSKIIVERVGERVKRGWWFGGWGATGRRGGLGAAENC